MHLEIAVKTVEERVYFYLDLFLKDPDSKAHPLVNLNGILRNVLEYTDADIEQFMQTRKLKDD